MQSGMDSSSARGLFSPRYLWCLALDLRFPRHERHNIVPQQHVELGLTPQCTRSLGKKVLHTIVFHLYANDLVEDIEKLRVKLIEASQVYSKDQETLSWFVMQDHQDPRAISVVERYKQESIGTRIFSDDKDHARY